MTNVTADDVYAVTAYIDKHEDEIDRPCAYAHNILNNIAHGYPGPGP